MDQRLIVMQGLKTVYNNTLWGLLYLMGDRWTDLFKGNARTGFGSGVSLE